MRLNFESWTGTYDYERVWLWQFPGIRPLFVLWYKLGGGYLSGWTPIVRKRKR